MTDKQRVTGSDIIQPRAAKTREKILREAIQLYAEKGYYKTTVDEIAKSAGLSVGTAYRYFKDKKELLLSALTYGFDHIAELADLSETDLLKGDFERILINFEKVHDDYFNLHEELEGLRHTDEDVRRLYEGFIGSALKYIHDKLPSEIKNRPHSFHDLRIAFGIMESHCHNCVYGRFDKKTITYLRKRTVELVDMILSGNKLKIC